MAAAGSSASSALPRPAATGPNTCSCTSSAITSRRSPTSTTPRRSPISRARQRPEPWEPNVTALHDPRQLKWRDRLTPGTPLPTPWPKEEFEELPARVPEGTRRVACGEPAGSGDERAVPPGTRVYARSCYRRRPQRRRRRVRRRELPGVGLLPLRRCNASCSAASISSATCARTRSRRSSTCTRADRTGFR